MKKRLQGKSATIAALVALVIISLVEIVSRGVILKKSMGDLSDAGEPIITVFFALMLIIFAQKGKDRLYYLLCGTWLGHFVFTQLFTLPGVIGTFVATAKYSSGLDAFSVLIHIIGMCSIIAIGGLLVEYMNDGTIYNKAFNILCAVTLLMFVINIILNIYNIAALNDISALVTIFDNLSQGLRIILFVFFAYDSAKLQLSKTNLTK